MNAPDRRSLKEQQSFYQDFFAKYELPEDDIERIETVAQLVAKYKGKKVLEAGCGAGHVTRVIRDDEMSLTAIDVWKSDTVLESKRRWPDYEFVLCSVAALPFKDGAFDTAVYSEVIEHLRPSDQVASVKELSRCLCQGGIMIMSTPNPWSVRGMWMRVVNKIRRGESSPGGQLVEEWLNPRRSQSLVRRHFTIQVQGGSWYWIPLLRALGLDFVAERISRSLRLSPAVGVFGLYQCYVLRKRVR